jgi:hypothetical protein
MISFKYKIICRKPFRGCIHEMERGLFAILQSALSVVINCFPGFTLLSSGYSGSFFKFSISHCDKKQQIAPNFSICGENMKFLSHSINSHLENYHLFELFLFAVSFVRQSTICWIAVKLCSEYGRSSWEASSSFI